MKLMLHLTLVGCLADGNPSDGWSEGFPKGQGVCIIGCVVYKIVFYDIFYFLTMGKIGQQSVFYVPGTEVGLWDQGGEGCHNRIMV